VEERLGIAGSGGIACGLAITAAEHGQVVMLARSDASAERAAEKVADSGAQVVTDVDELAGSTFVVEAIAEDTAAKSALLEHLNDVLEPDAILATTTSSLSIDTLAQASGRPGRFVGLHVFNPVPKMDLVELAFPDQVLVDTRERAEALCAALGKTAVEVPDLAGFVVNRLLFPYLFSAVALLEESGLEPEAIDTCMKLGAGHPMGPLGLLDFVGLDVSVAIGETLGVDIPQRVRDLVADGALGRKAGRGFYSYAKR
jgi:3-hydroxybutyryl-CoA dehydrogenase